MTSVYLVSKALYSLIKHQLFFLDPAVQCPDAAIDICALVEHADVMDEMALGPNGALVFCMELLLANSEWLKTELLKIPNKTYLLFDFPGQAELYSGWVYFQNIL